MKLSIGGILPAMVTPLKADGNINIPVMEKLIDFLIEGGLHGIFVFGTTGEFYAVSNEQYRDTLEAVVSHVNGRVPVFAGANHITTRGVIDMVGIAEKTGVDAVSVLTPMFISPSANELINHFKAIAQSTGLPILLYNNVQKTGVNIPAGMVEKLADIPNIVGIKDSSGDFTLTMEYIRRGGSREFYVFAGRDTLIYPCLCCGGHGAVAACANIVPRLCADIYNNFKAGNHKGALELQYKLAPLRMAFNLGTFPAVVKCALELLGIKAGSCCAPVADLSDENKEALKMILRDMGELKD